MADVSVSMGVTGIGEFKSAMNDAAASVKALDAQLKMEEAQLKSTGDKETYLQNKMSILKQQIEAQTKVVQNAKQAWETLLKNGADPMSKSVTDMQAKYYNANTALLQMTQSLQALESGSEEAAGGVDQAAAAAENLTDSVNGIGKRMSLDQVIAGIDTITGGLEKAAQKAIDLGKAVWSNVMDSAKWADDTATMAAMLDMTVDQFQRVSAVAATTGETSVEAWVKAKQKLANIMVNGSDSLQNILTGLGVSFQNISEGKNGPIVTGFRDLEDVFWDIGDALLGMNDATQRDAIANQIFGRSWRELMPMFKMGREAYEDALASVDTVAEDDVQKLAELNDKVTEVEQRFDTLKSKVIAEIAPALTKAADAIGGLLHEFNEYLDTEEGQQMLNQLGEAVSSLFGDLAEIDPEKAMESFTGVFTKLTDGFKWIKDNSGVVIGALQGIVAGWAGLKLTGGALEIVKLIQGIRGLAAGGAAAGAAEAGMATGSAWGAGFAKAALVAAPWLAGLITLLIPSAGSDATGDNTIVDENGNLTNEGKTYGYKLDENGNAYIDYEDRDWYKPVELPAELNPENDTAEKIAQEVGIVQIPAELVYTGRAFESGAWGGTPFGGMRAMQKANGIWSVPFDGYAAVLHKGERVVPAREVAASRSYSSNLYVESMYMNNGQDAEGLAAAMAAAQRRTMSGFGS